MSNLKSFLKHANRGLILGAVVLAGFIIFAVSDTIGFKKNKPQIEAAVNAYTDALAECAVTASDKASAEDMAEKLVENYWCSDRNSGAEMGFDMNNYKSEFQKMISQSFSDSDSSAVKKWRANNLDFRITKAGAGYALAEFTCEITAEYTGDPYMATPFETIMTSYVSDSEISSVLSKISFSCSGRLKLKEVDGKWKVCQAISYGWSAPDITFSGDSEGGNE